MPQLQHIGNVELVSLPNDGIKAVPAKVDTGADGSAIWASDIHEKDGLLTFRLFDRPSPFYNGKKLKTRHFQIRSVKNSFGETEFRYKVRLKTIIGGRTIWVRFTLANRANNRFPILIGRRTLHGKFLVDVTKSALKDNYRVLILSMKKTKTLERYAKNLGSAANNVSFTVYTYEDLNFQIKNNRASITTNDSGQDVATFDLVYFKTTANYQDLAATIARYLTARHIPFFDQAVLHFQASSKLYQYFILSPNGITVPDSLFVAGPRLKQMYHDFSTALGLPFVLKDIHGKKGDYNFLVKDEKSFRQAIKKATKAEVRLIGQKFIPNDGDYRLLVFGKRVGLIIHRQSKDTSHLNNTSKGGNAKLINIEDIATKVQRDSIQAALLLDREIAGIDMVQDKKTGSWYCFEVNDGPQLATGTFLTEKYTAMARFLQNKLKG